MEQSYALNSSCLKPSGKLQDLFSTVKLKKPAKAKRVLVFPLLPWAVSKFANWGCEIARCWCYLKGKRDRDKDRRASGTEMEDAVLQFTWF